MNQRIPEGDCPCLTITTSCRSHGDHTVDERKSAKATQHQKPLKQQARPHTNNLKTPMSLYAQNGKGTSDHNHAMKTSIIKLIIDKDSSHIIKRHEK